VQILQQESGRILDWPPGAHAKHLVWKQARPLRSVGWDGSTSDLASVQTTLDLVLQSPDLELTEKGLSETYTLATRVTTYSTGPDGRQCVEAGLTIRYTVIRRRHILVRSSDGADRALRRRAGTCQHPLFDIRVE
jgi:hypothetical protein